jgi:hypothetical protein
LPVHGATFDGALFTFDSLSHLPSIDDLELTLAQIGEALRPGAPLFFDVLMEEPGDPSPAGEYARVAGGQARIARDHHTATGAGAMADRSGRAARGNGRARHAARIRQGYHPPLSIIIATQRAKFGTMHWWHAESDLGFSGPFAHGRAFAVAQR